MMTEQTFEQVVGLDRQLEVQGGDEEDEEVEEEEVEEEEVWEVNTFASLEVNV